MDHGPDIVVTMWRPRGAEHGFHLEGIADTPMNDAWTDTLTFRFAPNKAMVLYELDDLETEQRMSHEEQIVFEKLLLLPGELSDFFADSSAQTA